MKEFTNLHIREAYRKKLFIVIVGAILMVLGVIFLVWGIVVVNKTDKNEKSFEKIAVVEKNLDNKKAYINVKNMPFRFATYGNSDSSYYIVEGNNEKLYIIYLSEKEFEKISDSITAKKPIKIVGITKNLNNDVKELAIEFYNDELNEEKDITVDDFNKIFGNLYLNLDADVSSIAVVQYCLAALSFMFSAIVLAIGVLEILSFRKHISRVEDPSKLNAEINDESTKFYKKCNLFITEKHIINFNGFVRIIDYKDILWMYKFEQNTDDVQSRQSIKLVLNTGIIVTIANIGFGGVKAQEEFQEIWNEISSKNSKILVGYTKENFDATKEMVDKFKAKEEKKNKRKDKKKKESE